MPPITLTLTEICETLIYADDGHLALRSITDIKYHAHPLTLPSTDIIDIHPTDIDSLFHEAGAQTTLHLRDEPDPVYVKKHPPRSDV